jgi:Trk-type K+ transport system membrane component
MLPNALNEPISYLEALFTSTSAVCVTGLIVLDTATAFTTLGKIIILSLIQVGGLGIMTFTGFFSYVFTGGSSLRDRFVLKDILSTENLNSLFSVLMKIILITFAIELVGAVIIFLNVPDSVDDKLLFSIFHSISAFCNAGFSTLQQGLFTTEVANNYQIQTTVALLIILGGIGFPVILWFFRYVERFFINSVFKMRHLKTSIVVKKDINISVVLSSTLILIGIGMVLYYLFENDTSLKGMGSFQKLMVTFFGSVSARTAGFNVADISLWGYPTVFMMIFLMWIGASPGSTGGGIKTTTFAIALRTAFSFIRGKKTLEMHNREIGTGTLVRVMVVITLSIMVIFIGFMGLIISDPDKNPVHLLFETFSAFGTVGLSIVNTSTLTTNSKIIIILLMFIGRVGPLTLLTGLFITNRTKKYKYAVVDVVIN